jgi:hypothetical protein
MQMYGTFKFVNKIVIIFLRDRVCETPEELISSKLFRMLPSHVYSETSAIVFILLIGLIRKMNLYSSYLKFRSHFESKLFKNRTY